MLICVDTYGRRSALFNNELIGRLVREKLPRVQKFRLLQPSDIYQRYQSYDVAARGANPTVFCGLATVPDRGLKLFWTGQV